MQAPNDLHINVLICAHSHWLECASVLSGRILAILAAAASSTKRKEMQLSMSDDCPDNHCCDVKTR